MSTAEDQARRTAFILDCGTGHSRLRRADRDLAWRACRHLPARCRQVAGDRAGDRLHGRRGARRAACGLRAAAAGPAQRLSRRLVVTALAEARWRQWRSMSPASGCWCWPCCAWAWAAPSCSATVSPRPTMRRPRSRQGPSPGCWPAASSAPSSARRSSSSRASCSRRSCSPGPYAAIVVLALVGALVLSFLKLGRDRPADARRPWRVRPGRSARSFRSRALPLPSYAPSAPIR